MRGGRLAAAALAFAVAFAAAATPDAHRNDESYGPLKALAERGAARGDPGAKAMLELIEGGNVSPADGTAMGEWLLNEARAGAPEAEYSVGAFLDTQGEPPERSLSWYLKAARKNYAPAQVAVARAYLFGKGVGKDPAQALEWCRKAVAQDYSFGQTLMGNMYVHGVGVAKDEAKAAQWYTKAALQGEAAAQGSLASLYYRGAGVPASFEKGEYWVRKAAEGGSKEAKAVLEQPVTVRQLIAATAGDARTQYRVGFGYVYGKYGYEKDPAKGVPWMVKAARQGYPAALDAVGYYYETGTMGLPRDREKALVLYRAAAAKGHPKSIERLKRLEKR